MKALTRRVFLSASAGLPAAAFGVTTTRWTPPPPEREWHVPVRGGRLYVRANGDLAGHRPPVVLIHGGPGANHAYLIAALQLADDRAVVLYDQLDCGLSDHPGDPGNWTVDWFVSEIGAICAALEIEALHLVGHSWGGALALTYAARRPAGLVSLTLASPLVSAQSYEASCRARLATLSPAIQQSIEANERNGTIDGISYLQAAAVFEAHFVQRHAEPAYVTAYRRRTGMTMNDRLATTLCGPDEITWTGTLRHYDGASLLPRVAAPTLFLCGQYDTMSAAAAAPFARRVAHSRIGVIPDAGHLTPLDQPDLFATALRAHLTRADTLHA